jgi:competence CoiA-like predicted nuclease
MPFVAALKSTGARIVITDFERPREQLDPDDIVCQFPDCGAALFVKAGLVVSPHFAHRPGSPCQTKLESHPESAEHRLGKATVARWLAEHFKANGYQNVRIDLEVPVYEAGRVADVMVTFPGGMREAHEIQLAKIAHHDIERRTLAYHSVGIATVWWLGEDSDADQPSNREWLLRELGECPLVRLGEEGEGDGRLP